MISNARLALLSGLLCILAWPVDGISFFIFLAFIPLLAVEQGLRGENKKRSGWKVFGYSYMAALIWNLGTTWWLFNASVVGMLFANLANSSFYALLFTIYHWAAKRMPQRSAYIFFVSLWLAFEKGHQLWDFSWPWLNLGNVFSESIHWVQWYEYTGSFGGSLWVLLVNILGFEILKKWQPQQGATALLKRSIPWWLAIAVPITLSLVVFVRVPKATKTTNVAVIQPNIDPYTEKYKYSNTAFLELLSDLVQPLKKEKVDFILTPETYFAAGAGEELNAFPQNPFYSKFQQLATQYPSTHWVMGIQFYQLYFSETPPNYTANQIKEKVWVDYYNSAFGVQVAHPIEVYHKSKLVVGVEDMPFKKYLKPLLGNLMLDLGGTISSRAKQAQRSVFTHGDFNIKIAPIICYESIYGEFVTEYVRLGAQFLGIITNDAWWGNTPGHQQLLSYSRLRAIENRRAIARSANTGISAFINARGELEQTLGYTQKGYLLGAVPLYDTITFYSTYGDYLARWAVFLAGLFFLLALSNRLKQHD